jgi:calcineurin-like phosphoesterase family protein
MGKNFYISDLHFGHKNCIAFDDRPFNSIEEMDEVLIKNWNSVVSNDDTVYILGDMFWYKPDKAIEILEQLNGRKRLIKGNHDRCHDNQFRKYFDKISDYEEINDNGRNVVLCHYPIPCFKNHFYLWYHLYGHTHTSFESNMMENIKKQMKDLYAKPCEMYNVGCMLPWINYTPKTLDEIVKGYEAYHKQTK